MKFFSEEKLKNITAYTKLVAVLWQNVFKTPILIDVAW